MATSSTSRFYHCFPRRGRGTADEVDKGLRILKCISCFGLLLTPEIQAWTEFLETGTTSSPIHISQKRICFTELKEHELAEHMEYFGSFALEFSVENLRQLGAMPVFYFPKPSAAERALEGVAASIIARLADVQLLLTRLSDISGLISQSTDKSQRLLLQSPAGNVTLNCSLAAAESLIAALSHGIQPPAALLNTVRATAGLFYPTEDLSRTGPLHYYRQREWRILGNMQWRGTSVTRSLSSEERQELVDLESEFFTKELIFPSGRAQRVDECLCFPSLLDRLLLAWSDRVLVPRSAVSAASEMLRDAGFRVPVVPVPKSWRHVWSRCKRAIGHK